MWVGVPARTRQPQQQLQHTGMAHTAHCTVNVWLTCLCCCVCLTPLVVLQLSSYASGVDYSASEAASISSRLELISKLGRRLRVSQQGGGVPAGGVASGLLELQAQWAGQLEQFYASQGEKGGRGNTVCDGWQHVLPHLQAVCGCCVLQV